MNERRISLAPWAPLCAALLLGAGCSGPAEDPRITLCKRLTESAQGGAQAIEWQGSEYSFYRPEYAVVSLRLEVVDADGRQRALQSACHYAYEALDDTAVTLANPIEAYGTLPFAMATDGRFLSDAELIERVNTEQRRQGEAVLAGLEQGARDLAAKLRAAAGQ
jgi:hypothetical protein